MWMSFKTDRCVHWVAGAAGAILMSVGSIAHAACADARTAGQGVYQSIPLPASESSAGFYGHSGIVGTWRVSYTAGGQPFADAFIQWHSDGTEWENIGLPVLSGTICMGEWKALDGWRVSRNHIGWLYTNGALSGYFTETETALLSADGRSYHGTTLQKIYNLAGTLQAEVPGTSTATRLAP